MAEFFLLLLEEEEAEFFQQEPWEVLAAEHFEIFVPAVVVLELPWQAVAFVVGFF